MITTIAPQTLLLGLWLVCTLLALCGKLPLLTSVLRGTSAFLLLVYHLTVPQHIAIIVSVLLWFILWRLGTAIHRHSKKKSQAATQQKRPAPMVQSTHQPAKQTAPIAKRGHPAAKASARIATAEVNALVDQTVEIAGWMLDAGHGASLVTNAAYEGAILVAPLQEKNSPRWQMALMMLSTPDLAQAQQSFLARNANTVRQHPEIFSPLCWFTENYSQNYIQEDKMYLLLTEKSAQLPQGCTSNDLQTLCIQEIIRRCPQAVKGNNGILYTRNVPR